MEETQTGRNEEAIASAAIAGTGAILVGVGAALAYLLSKREKDFHRIPRAAITLEKDGSLSHYGDLTLEVEEDDPPAPYRVVWFVTNRGPARVLAFENFERRHDNRRIIPLQKEPGRRIRIIPAGAVNFPVGSFIDQDAVADVLADPRRNRHDYKYDIWVDRVRQADPEIAIIRR